MTSRTWASLRVFGSVLLLVAMGCAPARGHGGAASDALPVCSGDVLGISMQSGSAIARESLVRLGLIEPDAEIRLVAAGLPELLNRREFQRNLARAYPAELRNQGLGGTGVYAVRIDEEGAVADVRILESSGFAALDRGGADALRRARFSAPVAEDCRAPMWIRLPLAFRVHG